ncbi:unnamed protein product [Paramecium sonneborni]|uniref:Uncharacterized protein n=1 Tax=Paramecium sonneborni TaxID=65129 RepID=A0A8S1RPI4_9CILI|nr:unnamed protein product [Paramecium sonneborni]
MEPILKYFLLLMHLQKNLCQDIEQKLDLENQEIKQNNRIKILNNLDIIRKEKNFNIYQYPRYYKSSIECLEDYKTIILIGTQSSEKQNLINLFINYYYGVEFLDTYRFEIVDDIDITKEKQNDEYEQMKVYYIIPQNGKSGLKIIYTPDYNDDLCYDDQNKSDKIYNVISNSIQLNQNILIGFANSQQISIGTFYMLESILSIFPSILISKIEINIIIQRIQFIAIIFKIQFNINFYKSQLMEIL